MSDYLPSFIVEPVLRQARRFSRLSGGEESPGLLPSISDFQRFNPTRLWNASPSPSNGEDEASETTLQSLARNIQLWTNQINNLDIIPSPPLEGMDASLSARTQAVEDATNEFAPLDSEVNIPERPVRLEEQRTASETSLNPAHELSFRSTILADTDRGRSQSDPLSHPGHTQAAHGEQSNQGTSQEVQRDNYSRRDGSGALPEDDGMGPLRQRITAVWAGSGTAAEKSLLVHTLMTERYRRTQPSPAVNSEATKPYTPQYRPTSPLSLNSSILPEPIFNLSRTDLEPSYAPMDSVETLPHSTADYADTKFSIASDASKADLGCIHYKRNVKMLCNTCGKWYTCRLCHDEAEDHTLPRRETKYMLCMLCHTPQPVGQVCRMCTQQAACYYCSVCKLWNNDPHKSVYHCDDCGICRLGEGLGKDFFHCNKCAACMSIQAESTHKCIEKSTKCDCPICGEYMFTSNKPVAFMRCGHSIHESCFGAWCNTSYKCPICSKSIANMESQFRRLDRHIEDQPMPEEYRDNRAYIFCNDCNSRSITRYHWLGLKCALCESYNTTQLELLGPEQKPQLIHANSQRAQELGLGEAGITASQSHTPTEGLISPATEDVLPGRSSAIDRDTARSPIPRGSPFLLPHSPTRSARSVTPVVGSYFGTGQRPEETRRSSYFSVFSAGQAEAVSTPRSASAPVAEDDDLDFWGGQSPRSQDEGVNAVNGSEGDSASDDDDRMEEDEDEDEGEEGEDEDAMDIFGHR